MEDSGGVWHRIAEPGALELAPENRLHLKIDGRYVSIIKYQERLYCLDSVCFHAGGPLALGDIEELDGGKMMMPATGETTTTSEQTARDGGGKKSEKIPCLVCPWHFYHVSLRDGDKWYQAAQAGEDGKLHPGDWKSVGQRQRIHTVEQRPDGIFVQLNLDGALASDEYACKSECGTRVKIASLRVNSHGGGGEREGARSPGRPASPLRGTPPASPRAMWSMEGEDVWPEDLVADSTRGSPSRRRSSASGGNR